LSFAEIVVIRKLRVPDGLSSGVVRVILRLAVSQKHRQTDRRTTDRQTETRLKPAPVL